MISGPCPSRIEHRRDIATDLDEADQFAARIAPTDRHAQSDHTEGVEIEPTGAAGIFRDKESGQQHAMAIALPALLSGGVSMVRAVNDPGLAKQILAAVRSNAMTFRTKS